jgi:hypothetical protein
MDCLAEIFHETRGDDMRDFSHIKGLPWKVYGKGEGKNKPINPALSFDSDPMMHNEPTIEKEEHEYRRELLKGIV